MARKRDQLAALTETSKTDPKTTVEYEKYLESKHKAERKYWAEQKAKREADIKHKRKPNNSNATRIIWSVITGTA